MEYEGETGLRCRRALVIDDDALARRILCDALHDRGFDVVVAEDGHAGFHAIVEELFALDLVLVDLEMPNIGGERLIGLVRSLGCEHELPLIVVSAYLSPERKALLAAAGADAALDKSLGPAEIVLAAEGVLVSRAAALH